MVGKTGSLMLAAFCTVLTLPVFAQSAERNPHIDMAARINVAENLCDINFGNQLLHFVMLGAAELGVSGQTAAELADLRHRQIVAHLNKTRKLDEFCTNARSGRL